MDPGWDEFEHGEDCEGRPGLQTNRFCILDENFVAHAEWRNIKETAPSVSPWSS